MLKKRIIFKFPKVISFKVGGLIFPLSLLFFALLLLTSYNLYFSRKIFPNVYAVGVSISGFSPEEAAGALAKNISTPSEIVVIVQGQPVRISATSVSVAYDFPKTADNAYTSYRSGDIFADIYQRLLAFMKKQDIPLEVSVNQEALNAALSAASQETSIEPVYPTLKYVSPQVVVEKGSPGQEADLGLASEEIIQRLSYLDPSPVVLKITSLDPSLSDEEAAASKKRGEGFIGKTLVLSFEEQTFIYKEPEIFKLLDPSGGYKLEEIEKIASSQAKTLNRDPKNPTFIFEEGKVKEFEAAKTGIKVEEERLSQSIAEALSTLEEEEEKILSVKIPAASTQPQIQTGDVNNLGIRELLGRGVSTFRGSIVNRIHNISLASSKFKGILVSPGQAFSFNDALGDVSVFTGYKQAFVIKDGKTVLGDGGGVCQVSTTLFRAALNAGLPIVERRAHSYRVGYYEQNSPPGLDATVYAPTTDLKFLNDTPGHLLIQTSVDTKTYTLTFEIYGTSDGRVATVSKPVVTGVSAPPEDLYVDDPTLPAGQIKQIDFKAWGAKVSFNYSVERDGETIYEKAFLSNYRPWQAVFLRGTAVTQ